MHLTLNYKEREWLNNLGGRSYDDVKIEEETGRKYIIMWNGDEGKDVKVYLPLYE